MTRGSAHSFDGTILREYDIRGIVDDTLTGDDAYAIGRAFGSEIVRTGGDTVCVGYDGRLSSPYLSPRHTPPVSGNSAQSQPAAA